MKKFLTVCITASCRILARLSLASLACLSAAPWYCSDARAQTILPQILDYPIPAGRINLGTGTNFLSPPYPASSASLSVVIDDATPENLKVVVSHSRSGVATSVLLWDHEQVIAQNNHDIHAVATFTGLSDSAGSYSYFVQVLDDRPGPLTGYVGTFKTATLTLNPSYPGHTGPPTVNLYGGIHNEALPGTVNFGHSVTFVATAHGNSSSYKIKRLGIKITEIVAPNTINQHPAGIGPGFYQSTEISQAPSLNLATLPYTPPLLPPGVYRITATAWDSAGFEQTLSKMLTVTRVFGFASVSVNSRTVNSTCPEPEIHSCGQPDPQRFPCNTTTFSATLNLINKSEIASRELRVRLISVAGSAFVEALDPPPLPNPTPLPPLRIYPVNSLPAHTTTPVALQVGGVVPAPQQMEPTGCGFGIGFQVYAILEESLGSGQWTIVDSIKVTEGEWPIIGGFGGPGGGVLAPRPGLGGSSFNPNLKLFKNLSSRAHVLTGNNVLIGGFVVRGNVPKKVIVRAIGPSLAQYNVPGVLADPVLELHKMVGTVDTIIATNDNWRSTQAAEIQATGHPPTNNFESAIVTTVVPGTRLYSDRARKE